MSLRLCLAGMGASIFLTGCYGLFPLHMASVHDDADEVRRMIAEGSDPNLVGPSGELPLHWSVRAGRLDTTRALLEGGALPNAMSMQQRPVNRTTVMHMAVSGNHEKIVELLIAHGARVNVKDGQGRTLLAVCRNDKIRAMLIAHGAR